MTVRKPRAGATWDRLAFAALVQRRGSVAVARELGVRTRNVQRWANGVREPDAGARSAIAALIANAAPTLPRDARSSTAEEPAPSPSSPSPQTPAPEVGPLDLRAETIEAIRLHRNELRRLEADRTSSPRDRQHAATSLNTALRLLAKLDGAGEVTQGQILRSPAWRRCAAVILEVAAKFPGCSEAMGKAMRELEAEEG